jgi:hypothetical protein bfra3_16308
MTTIKERIKDVAQYYGLSIRAFEERCGLGRGNISNMGNESGIGSDKLSKIIDTFPEVSLNWLVMGTGRMLTGEEETGNVLPVEFGNKIPLVPINAMAGAFQGEQNVMFEDCPRYSISLFPNADYLISIKGDSMFPSYNSGDIVACKRINYMHTFLQWGRVYVIDAEEGVLIKRVFEGGREDTIRLVSDNVKYPPMEVPKAEIYHMAIVLGTVRFD